MPPDRDSFDAPVFRVPMMSPAFARLRRPALAAAAGVAACAAAAGLGAGPVVATTPVSPGEITGKVEGSKPASSKGVVVVRAFNAATGAIADVATVGRRGTYTLVVPPGAYAVRATVVSPGRSNGDATIPVTVKERQKRAGVTFRVKPSGAVAKAARAGASSAGATAVPASEPSAIRNYVTTDGTEVAGVSAYAVEEFTGGSGDWKRVGRALPAFIQTELYDSTTCAAQGIVNARERRYLESSLRFRSGRVVTKGTKVQRNLIVADLGVTGKITGSGSRATVSFAVVDKRTGKVLDSLERSITKAKFTSGVRKLSRQIGQRLCRTPPAYELTLNVNGTADVQTHTATGVLAAKMIAKKTGGTGGQPDVVWRATDKLKWSQVAYKNKTTSDKCQYVNIVPASGSWTASLSVIGGQLTVDWATNPEFYVAFTVATYACPNSQPVTNQPGPSFAGILPNAQRLPLSGGVLPVAGELNVVNQIVRNRGTLTVKPLWSE